MTNAELTARLASLTGTNAADWHLVFKARYGMLAAFDALAASAARRRVRGDASTHVLYGR